MWFQQKEKSQTSQNKYILMIICQHFHRKEQSAEKAKQQKSLFYTLKWLNKLHRAKMTFLPAIRRVPGQQPTPGGDRAVAVYHPWAISPCSKEERGVTLFSGYGRNCLNYLQWTEGQLRGRGWRGQCNAIGIDPARKKNKLSCIMKGGLTNVEGGPFSNVILTV